MAVSKFEKYLVRKPVYERFSGVKNRQSPAMTYMSRAQVPESNYYLEYGWIQGIPEPNPYIFEHVHDTDEIILYLGGDPDNPEDLGGEIEIRVGGQPLIFSSTSALFVPRGVKHGPVIWHKFRKPHIEMILTMDGTAKENQPKSSIPETGNGLLQQTSEINYEKYLVRKPIYERGSGVKNRQSPTMTFMSTNQVPEANYYLEYGWIYGIPEPNPNVTRHVHKNDELIVHFGGNPQEPEDLGGKIEVMVEDEPLVFDTTTALLAPKGLTHCPVTWKEFRKPHLEMAITLGYGKR